MPIYSYAPTSAADCDYCRGGFDCAQRLAEAPLEACPKCGAPVKRQITCPSIGRSKSSLDQRAKAAGFTKLKKLGKGEYEKQY